MTDSIYINPLTDFGFKYLFGDEGNKDFLISFLNSLFPEEGPIVKVTYLNKEHIGDIKDSRALIYDIHCTTSTGKKFIVEMQNRYQTYFRDRALFYTSADIYKQGKKGKSWDYSLTPVYGVFLMNFDWREFATEPLREDICLMNIRTHKVFSDKLKMVFLKLPLLNKSPEECVHTLERWLYILKNLESMQTMPKTFAQDPIFNRLGQVARLGALSKSQRAAYDQSLKNYRDSYAIAATERAEGRAEGRTEGRAEGRTETARNLIAMGMADNFIEQATGLSKDEIATLRK